MTRLASIGLLLFASCQALQAEEVSGIIIPRDNDGMYVRNDQGQFEVEWTPATRVALMTNTRQFKNLADGTLNYSIHSSTEVVPFTIPSGPITGIKTSRGGSQLKNTLLEANKEKWLGLTQK